jgi:hypothetical protein
MTPRVKICCIPSIGEARAAAKSVDALLLDSGNPALQVMEPGGQIRTDNKLDTEKLHAFFDSVNAA